MKVKNYAILALIMLLSALLVAGTNTSDKASKIRAFHEGRSLAKPTMAEDRKLGLIDNGRMRMYFDNNGFIGDRNFTRSIEWPAGSINYLVWQVGIIFGGVTAGGDTICSESYFDISDVQFNPEPGYDNPAFTLDLLGGPMVARSDILESYPAGWNSLWPALGGGTTDANALKKLARQESYWVMRDNNDPVASPGTHLNLEVEARLIQINSVLTQDFIFAFYKVRNTLPERQNLTRCRFGILVDPDVPALVGAEYEDDDSNFIRDLNLAYARDSDNFYASKPDLNPGHFGVKFLRSPKVDGRELGLTAWTTFEYGDMPDIGEFYLTEDGPDPNLGDFDNRDHAQYGYMQPGLFMKPRFKRDVAFVMSSGDFDLAQGDSVEIGVAFLAAPNFDALINNAKAVQTVFDSDFRIPTAPAPPAVVAVPGNEKVTLYWDAEPSESSLDELTGKRDFEGYRLYRSERQGRAGSWGPPSDNLERYPTGVVPLAEYDVINIPGELASIVVTHSNQLSDATIASEGLADGSHPGDAAGVDNSGFFSNDNYQIIFDSDSTFQVLNASQGLILNYLSDLSAAIGFTVLDEAWAVLANSPGPTSGLYRSGYHIYITGLFVTIEDGTGPPRAGDVFTVDQRRNDAGRNVGLAHRYVDENLPNQPKRVINGYEYWYTVAAYDRPDLVFGAPANENQPENDASKPTDQTVAVIPQEPGAGMIEANVDTSFVQVAGNSDVEGFVIEVIDPTRVTGHRYEISFNDTAPDKTYSVKDLTASDQPLKLVNEPFYDASADNARVFDGIRLLITDVELNINAEKSGQTAPGGDPTLTLNVDSIEPRSGANDHDYLFKFLQNPEDSASFAYTYTDWDTGVPVTAPFVVIDQATGDTLTVEILDTRADEGDSDGTYDVAERIVIGDTKYTGGGGWEASAYSYRFAFDGTYATGTQFLLVTNKPLTSVDRYQFSTTARTYTPTSADLAAIRVVPNPFIVTSAFDLARDRHEIHFTRLPEKCTIKIFTLPGDLVKTIAYDRNADGVSFAKWDLKTEFGSEVAFGVYLYHLDAGSLGTRMGKFAILR